VRFNAGPPSQPAIDALVSLGASEGAVAAIKTEGEAKALLATLARDLPIPNGKETSQTQLNLVCDLYNEMGVPLQDREFPDSKRMCSILIDVLLERVKTVRQNTPPTTGQMKMLSSMGVNIVPKTKGAATRIIDALKENEAHQAFVAHQLAGGAGSAVL
jgi:hypothetical protein